jgi:NAD(P)H-flavin reductase
MVDDDLYQLSLEMPDAVSTAFARPGQFQRIRNAGGAESMFAIASAPGSTSFDYLIRRGTGVSEALSTLSLGTRFEVTAPEGPGFPLEAARGRDVLLVSTGTALAPIRSVLGMVAKARRDFKRVTLVQGQRNPRQLPWLDELLAVRDLDLHTVVNVGAQGWAGPVGVVQSVIPHVATRDTVAFLVGQREMTDDVTAILARHDVPASRVFLNL